MKQLIKILFVPIILSSCTVNSHVMLKTKNDYVFDTINYNMNLEYKIATNDIIDFRLFTNDGFEVIDMVSQNNTQNVNINQSNIIQYNIRKDSLVELPIIGEVNLVGKTIIESEHILENKYANFYVDPFINLRIKSKRVVIFPGTGSSAKVVMLKYNNTTLPKGVIFGSILSIISYQLNALFHNNGHFMLDVVGFISIGYFFALTYFIFENKDAVHES